MFKLVNKEDPMQIVAVEEDLQIGGGFGDIYRGKYFVMDSTRAPFERFPHVVAKKNRPSRRMTDSERQEEVRKSIMVCRGLLIVSSSE